MAYEHRNLAYDLRLFEQPQTQVEPEHTKNEETKSQQKTKKQNNVLSFSQKQITRIRRRKNNFFKIAVSFVFGFAVLLVIAAIIQGQVQLTELNQEINNAKNDLSEKQSIYTQLQMKVDASISTSVVEKYAQETLGMSKASNSQKEFISLSKGDRAEVSLSSHSSVFESIADAFSDIWS